MKYNYYAEKSLRSKAIKVIYIATCLLGLLSACENGRDGYKVSGFITTNSQGAGEVAVILENSGQDTIIADSQGYFEIPNVRPGTYTLTCQQQYLHAVKHIQYLTLNIPCIIQEHLLPASFRFYKCIDYYLLHSKAHCSNIFGVQYKA